MNYERFNSMNQNRGGLTLKTFSPNDNDRLISALITVLADKMQKEVLSPDDQESVGIILALMKDLATTTK